MPSRSCLLLALTYLFYDSLFAFNDIYDPRALQLVVHRMLIGGLAN